MSPRNRSELATWLILVALTGIVVLILNAGSWNDLKYSCEYDDQMMGSDGTCYEIDSFLDAAND